MYFSKMFLPTMREVPAEAEALTMTLDEALEEILLQVRNV